MSVLQDLIVSVRNLRAELAVEQKQRVPIQIFADEPAIRTLIEQNRGAVERLAGVEKVTFAKDSLARLSSVRHTARFDVHVVYEKKIDAAVERVRLKKELERIEKALLEDRATSDASSYACIDPNQRGAATIIAKQDCILAGLGCVSRILDVYAMLDGAVVSHHEVISHPEIFDGVRLHRGQAVA